FSAGDNSQPLVNGVATFGDLKVETPGTYTLTASDGPRLGVTQDTSDGFEIYAHADLKLTVSSNHTNVAGLAQTFTVKAENFGPNANTSYTVQATLPTDISGPLGTGTSGDCSLSVSTITCTRSGGIAVGGNDTFDIVLNVPPGYASGVPTRDLSLSVALTVTSPQQQIGDNQQNSATATDPIHAEANLAVNSVSTSVP